MNTADSTGAAPEKGLPQSFSLKWPVIILMVYFGLRLLFYAVAISPYVPPDEATHFAISEIYSRVSLLPENSPATYSYGLVTNIPYLYYWLMGRLLTLNVFGIPDLLFLRLLNIPFAFGTVFFVWRTLRLLTDDHLTQFLLIVAMTNTIMFSFLSASVHYDNLRNLFAAMAIYYLLAFFRNRAGSLLAASFLCQLAGSLTKISVLLLATILSVLLLVHEFRNLRRLPRALVEYLRGMNWRRLGLVFGIVVGLALNIQLYGGNYLNYGRINPDMSHVLSPDKAMQYRVIARNKIFILFKEGKVSFEQAMAMTSQIKHPGDRFGAMQLIVNYYNLRQAGVRPAGRGEYMLFWVRQMMSTIYGILGHLQMLNEGPTLWPFYALFLMAGLGLLIRWRPWEAGWLPSCLIVIVFSYSLYLMYEVNYETYLEYWSPTLALQGRYIFGIIGPIYVLFSYYLLRLFRGQRMRFALAVAASLVFIAFDFPYFLLHVTPQWFAPLVR
jgi:hypothetical protein